MSARQTISDFIISVTQNASNQSMDYAKAILTFSQGDVNIVNWIYGLIIPVATVAVVAYWLEGYLEMTANGREPSKDQIKQSFIWLIIGFFVMTNVYYLVSQFCGISNVVLNDFYQAIVDGHATETATEDNLYNEGNTITSALLDGFNFLVLIIALAVAILAWIINLLTNFVLGIVCLSTKVEIIARLCLVPIGIAPLASPTQKSEALRYLKKTLAAMFYGGVILIVIDIAMTGMSHAMSTFITGQSGSDGLNVVFNFFHLMLGQIIAPFAAIGAISSAKAIANEAFGG